MGRMKTKKEIERAIQNLVQLYMDLQSKEPERITDDFLRNVNMEKLKTIIATLYYVINASPNLSLLAQNANKKKTAQ